MQAVEPLKRYSPFGHLTDDTNGSFSRKSRGFLAFFQVRQEPKGTFRVQTASINPCVEAGDC